MLKSPLSGGNDERKTKAQLIAELAGVRQRVSQLETVEAERKHAEEALRHSEANYRTLMEQASDGIFIADANGNYTDVNSEGCALLGFSREEILQLNLKDVLLPEDISVTPIHMPELNAGQAILSERRMRRKDGSIFLAEISGKRLADGRLQGIVRDITERRQAEEALRESEERYRLLMETLPDGVIVHSQGRVVFTNPASATIMGMDSVADLAGKPVIEFVHPDYRELALRRIQQSLKEGVPAPFLEEKFVRLDGTPIDVEVAAIPITYAGKSAMLTVFTDITERKRVEERLAVERNLIRSLIDAVPDQIYAKDVESRFILANIATARLVGAARVDDILGKSDLDFFQPDLALQYLATEQSIVRDGQRVINLEEPGVDANGQARWQTTTKIPLRNAAGDIIGLVGVTRDITERKRMEIQLREQVAVLQALAEIDREIAAATEAKSILDLVCRHAAALVHAPKSAIVTRTAADEMEMTASYGLRDAASASAGFVRVQQAGSMDLSVLKTRKAIALNEIIADNPFMSATTASESARALAIAPLVAGEEAKGALIVLDTTVRQWQADELQILSMLAGQAAIALEKLQLLQTAHGHALHLATLNDIGQAITSSLDLDRVLLTLLEKVREATEAEACSVALVDQVSGDLVFRQAVGGATQAVIGLRLQPGEGLAGWVAQHRQSVLVPDAAADARAHDLKSSSDFVTRDLIGVPLIARDQVTGVIELINKRSGSFDEDDRRLLESVAAQAAIAIANARLFEIERAGRESLETLYRVGQAINSTLDVDTILDRLTDEAMQATHATHGSALVAQPERGGFERRSLRGYSPEQVEQARADQLPLDRGVNGRAYHSRQPVYIDDVQTDPDYHSLIPETRSELVVPILRGGQVIGNLDLQSPKVDAFRDVSVAFLQALTDQVSIALENARLFEETRRRMDEMSLVSQVALVGAAGRPFDETVVRATHALSRLWPEASLGFLFVDETGQSLHQHPAYQRVIPEITPVIDIPLDQGIVSWAVRERQPIRVGDVTADPRYLLTIPDVRSKMAAPLVVGQRVIGVIEVASPRLDAFSGDDLRLLTTLAGQLATIFEKARLDAELAEHVALLEQRVVERTRELSVANEQLKELDRAKDQFVSNVSHELRTPLANLKLYLSLLERGKPEKRAEYMQTLHREQQRLDRMIEDLLDLSRLDLGITPIQPVPTDLSLLLSQLIADRTALAAEQQLVLDYQPDDALPLALIDPVMLTEVITNLVGNAVNYTPGGGVITVITAAREQAGQRWVTFTVQDNGPGISARDLPHLFERFYRGEVGRKASAPGTGLGLAISKEIVEKMGGRITVESEPGHGAAFTVWLRPAD